jgi:uncharacterized protein
MSSLMGCAATLGRDVPRPVDRQIAPILFTMRDSDRCPHGRRSLPSEAVAPTRLLWNKAVVDHTLITAGIIGVVALLYATAGQAGGTAFLAVMALEGFAATELRPTALLLNIVAAGYATWQRHRRAPIPWRLLTALTLPSLLSAFLGGFLVLDAPTYFLITGLVLIGAAPLLLIRRGDVDLKAHPVHLLPAALIGGAVGLLSGLTGVGGGVFLAPSLIALRWASPRQAAALSPPFILCNSVAALIGALAASQRVAAGAPIYAVAAVAGAIFGTAIGRRWMSERATRYVLAAILLFTGLRLLGR